MCGDGDLRCGNSCDWYALTFFALHKVEEFGIDRPIPKPVYKRSEVLQITGWSRTTLWRKCDDIGPPAREKAFTQTELEKLVQWDSD
jgi:predicted DNA-binding transcriptional regulator AlpA